ncbi:unnamed protein product, partial [Effrenium voratum]
GRSCTAAYQGWCAFASEEHVHRCALRFFSHDHSDRCPAGEHCTSAGALSAGLPEEGGAGVSRGELSCSFQWALTRRISQGPTISAVQLRGTPEGARGAGRCPHQAGAVHSGAHRPGVRVRSRRGER